MRVSRRGTEYFVRDASLVVGTVPIAAEVSVSDVSYYDVVAALSTFFLSGTYRKPGLLPVSGFRIGGSSVSVSDLPAILAAAWVDFCRSVAADLAVVVVVVVSRPHHEVRTRVDWARALVAQLEFVCQRQLGRPHWLTLSLTALPLEDEHPFRPSRPFLTPTALRACPRSLSVSLCLSSLSRVL